MNRRHRLLRSVIAAAAAAAAAGLLTRSMVKAVTGKGSRPPGGAVRRPDRPGPRPLPASAGLHPHTRSPRPLLGQRGPMTHDGARDVLNARAAQAGVADVHPHRFRHTFAHRWLAGDGQERDLMMLAGWQSDDVELMTAGHVPSLRCS